jgi:tetratricopeptide (TPR) repeat protein
MESKQLQVSKIAREKAAQLCEEGLDYYAHWDIERAIEAFKSAVALNRWEPDYCLYLAQAYVRLGNYDMMRKALGRFMQLEKDPELTERFERLFGSAMDEVETYLTQTMTQHDVPLEVIGAAIQMWLEFRVAIGRQSIAMDSQNCRAWASGLDFTIRKVNFHEVDPENLAEWYGVTPQATREKYSVLVEGLDVMPCDYRYFRGPENPLDKLIEAATMLEELEERFYRI